MDYKKIYEDLILSRKNRIVEDGVYYEKHHIVMRSMGGLDNPDNIVPLLAREHFIAHRLLWLIHRNRQTAFAFRMMCCRNKTWSSKFYEKERLNLKHSDETKRKIGLKSKGRKWCQESKDAVKGKNSHRFGVSVNHSVCTRNKMSTAKTGKKLSVETKKKISNTITGRILAEDWKHNISIGLKRNAAKPNYVNPMQGKTFSHTDNAKMQISKKLGKPVLQYLDNILIAEFHSASLAFKETRIKNISLCCNGHRNTAGGFVWKWKLNAA